jgi:hypothetical protein
MDSPAADWKQHHALGLPGGSVRALMALGMVGTVCGLLIRDPSKPLPEPLESLLFVVLGHYFAARGQAPDDDPAGGPPPLWLPRGTVRFLLIGGLVAAGVVVVRAGGEATQRGMVTLVVVAAFLLGLLLTRVTGWFKKRSGKPWRPFEDLRALVGIGAAGVLAAHAFYGILPGPESLSIGRVGLEQGLAGLVGFYFGSRS